MDGDSNSKYFHAFATTRKKRSLITKLRSYNGEVITDHDGICNVVNEYFVNLFDGDEVVQEENVNSGVAVVTDGQNLKLVEDFTFEEFSTAIKQMHPDKSACPDGLYPAFYQNFWNLMGKDVFSSCKQWLHKVNFPAKLNDTTIVLIPTKRQC